MGLKISANSIAFAVEKEVGRVATAPDCCGEPQKTRKNRVKMALKAFFSVKSIVSHWLAAVRVSWNTIVHSSRGEAWLMSRCKNLTGLLECDWPIVCPVECGLPFPNAFYGLFARQIRDINPKGSGNVPCGAPAYHRLSPKIWPPFPASLNALIVTPLKLWRKHKF